MPFYQNFKDFGSIGKLESQDENIIGAPIMIMRDKRLSILGNLAMIAIFKAIALPTTAIAIVVAFSRLREWERATTIAVAITRIGINIRGAIEKIWKDQIYKTVTKDKAKRIKATTFIIAKFEER